MNSASAPRARNSFANVCPASSRRPETTMRLPSAAKASAAARPMPVNAPVIKTTGVLISSLLGMFDRARLGVHLGFARICEKDFVGPRPYLAGMAVRGTAKENRSSPFACPPVSDIGQLEAPGHYP